MATDEERKATFDDPYQIVKIHKLLQEQRSVAKFCDVILKVCDEQIFAHSNVLAAASPYFANLFSHGPDLPRAFSQKAPQIIEIRIDGSEGTTDAGYADAVTKVVDFVYTNSIDLTYGIVNQVVEIARIMQMNSILEFCDKFQQGHDGNEDRISYQCGNGKEKATSIKSEGENKDTSELNSSNSRTVEYSSINSAGMFMVKKGGFHSNRNFKASKPGKRKRGRPRKSSYELEPQGMDTPKEETANEMVMTEEEKSAFKVEAIDESKADNNPASPSSKSNTNNIQPSRVSARLKSAGRSRYSDLWATASECTVRQESKEDSSDGDSENKAIDESESPKNIRSFFQCPDCNHSVATLALFRKHRKTHENDHKYNCNKCDFVSTRLKELTKHKHEHMHAEKQCSFCGWICGDKENDEVFQNHLAQHSGPLPYFCMSCDRKFRTRTQLNFHIPKHSLVKPFVCNICQAAFKWKHALKNHMITHKATKDHLCDVCGFSTAHKSQLKAHRLIHTGETFKCKVEGCLFQATKQQNLKYHMLSHTHEKPHQCEICGQAFSLIKNMKRHMLLHTNERPFKCEQCSFSTTRYDKLKEHYFKQHNIGIKPGKKMKISDYQEYPNMEEYVMTGDLQDTDNANIIRSSEDEMQTIEVQVADGDGTSTQFITHVENAAGETVPIAIATVDGNIQLTEVQYQEIPTIHLVTQTE